MRIKFVALSALMGCLALSFGLPPGRRRLSGAVPAGRGRIPRAQFPAGPAPGPVSLTDRVDRLFRRLDRDGDGFLGDNEMMGNLAVEKDRWDGNGDGRMDLAEWREYTKAFIARQRRSATHPGDRVRGFGPKPGGRGAARPPLRGGGLSRPGAEGNAKGTASHAAKLPSNLPAWFRDCDTGADGQVALHEWKRKKRTVRDFHKYDLNEDGFITIEEMIRSGNFALTGKTPKTTRGLRAKPGEFFYFEVTGASAGTVWGTDVYTADSPIAAAAVHAGLLRVGQTGLVKVTILPGQERYRGSLRNGVRTRNYGRFASSYRVERAPSIVQPRRSPPANAKGPTSHAGTLPSNLPGWFKDCDTGADGQVALYEWKRKRRAVRDFHEYDLNEDGFITIEELVRSGNFTSTGKTPKTMRGLRAQAGEFFYFEVTGASSGTVWGTDVYTTDSPIAAAVVHAGLLRVGQTGLVKVTVLPGQDRYRGSSRNGVTTRNYGAYASSYRVERAPQAPPRRGH
jgi:Ca2+-binding EF-hand superfamily protein